MLHNFCVTSTGGITPFHDSLEIWLSSSLDKAMSSANIEDVTAPINNLNHDLGPQFKLMAPPEKNRYLATCIYYSHSKMESVFGTALFIRRTTYEVRKEGHTIVSNTCIGSQISVVFHPSQWLLRLGCRTGLRAALQHSAKGWDFTIATTRPVPDDSLVFDLCKAGSVEGVKALFKRGEASPMDIDSRGYTPLHVSFLHLRIRLVVY